MDVEETCTAVQWLVSVVLRSSLSYMVNVSVMETSGPLNSYSKNVDLLEVLIT